MVVAIGKHGQQLYLKIIPGNGEEVYPATRPVLYQIAGVFQEPLPTDRLPVGKSVTFSA